MIRKQVDTGSWRKILFILKQFFLISRQFFSMLLVFFLQNSLMKIQLKYQAKLHSDQTRVYLRLEDKKAPKFVFPD